MRSFFSALLALAAFLPEVAHGQQAASTSSAGKPCGAPGYRQFDFWVGDWEVSDPSGKRVGTNRIERVFGACVLQEHWTGAGGTVGSSFNTFVPATGRWHQTWVDNGGTLLLLDGGFASGTMTLAGQTTDSTGTTRHRIRWSLINGDPNRVRQLWESSTDGGKTWTVAFDGRYARARPH